MRVLDGLPWRHKRRYSARQLRAKTFASRNVDQTLFPNHNATRRKKSETTPLCSTVSDDLPPSRLASPPQPAAPPTPPLPLVPGAAPAQAVPPAPPADADATEQVVQADAQRRLVFARYLVRRGTFNEGFSSDALPAQYRDRRKD